MQILNTIDKDFLDKNQKNFGWKGTGTKINPIIINNDENLSQNIEFKTGNLYININVDY